MNQPNPLQAAQSADEVIFLLGSATPTQTNTGRSSHVVTTKGGQVKTAFKIVDASQLVISNNQDGTINPNFPAELQPRDRTRLTSKIQVQKIAASLRPEQLTDSGLSSQGAPIIGPDNVVESGNGRSMGILRAYQQGQADDYRQFLIDNAADYGLSADEISRFKHPVLVRERQTEVDRAQFARDSNISDLQEMSASEKAFSDAQFLTDHTMALFSPSDDGNLLAKSNMPFVHAFLREIGDTASAGLLTDDGRPTKQLIDRLQNAIFAKAYKDDRLVKLVSEEPDPDMRNILTALNVAASDFAQMSVVSGDNHKDTVSELVGGIEEASELDKQAIAALQDAINLVREAKDNGQAIEEVIAQRGLFAESSKEAEALAMFIVANNRSAKRMGEAFKLLASKINDEIIHQQQAIGDMFGTVPVDLKAILSDVSAQIEKNYGQGKGLNFAMFESATGSAGELLQYCESEFDVIAVINAISSDNKRVPIDLIALQKAAANGVSIDRLTFELHEIASHIPITISLDDVKSLCIRWMLNAYPLPNKLQAPITDILKMNLDNAETIPGVISALQSAMSEAKRSALNIDEVMGTGRDVVTKAGVTKNISSTVIADGYTQSLTDLKDLATKYGQTYLATEADSCIEQLRKLRNNPDKLMPYIQDVLKTRDSIRLPAEQLRFFLSRAEGRGEDNEHDFKTYFEAMSAFSDKQKYPSSVNKVIHSKVKNAFDSLTESAGITSDQSASWAKGIVLGYGFKDSIGEPFDTRQVVASAYALAGGKIKTLTNIGHEPGIRAYASKHDKSVVIDRQRDSEDVLWHEIGHHIEFSNPHLLDRAKSFLKMKAGSRVTYFNSGSVGKPEYIVRAGMSKPYMSKIYMSRGLDLRTGKIQTAKPSISKCLSTEVFSMGLQLYKNPDYAAESVLNDDGLIEFFLGCMKELHSAN